MNGLLEVTLSGNEFIGNVANLEGGAIKWSLCPPILGSNLFLNNKAKYGDDIAGLPALLLLEVFSSDKASLVFSVNSSEKNRKLEVLGNVSSGKDFPYILSFKILDSYGNVMKTDQS